MIACYDLARNPPTYDVVAFLAHAELERQRVGAREIELYILPGPAGGFRQDGLWPRTIAEREMLRSRVLEPLCWLLPSVGRITVARARGVEGFGAGGRLIGLLEIMRVLRAGCRPLRPRVLEPPAHGLITFTLREAEHHPLRNSRTQEWVAAARELGRLGHRVVIVRDAFHAHEEIPDVTTVPEASLNVYTRAALYARADLNVGICNGPMWMAIFMDAPVAMLRPTTNAAGGCYDDRFYTQFGLPTGSQLPTSPPYQRLVWEEDYCPNIVRAVEEMLPLAVQRGSA